MFLSLSIFLDPPPPFHLWPFLCIPFHFAFLFAFGLLAVRIHSLIHIHCALVFRGVGVFMPEIPLIHSKRGNAVKMLPKKTAEAKNETMAGAHKVRSGNFSVCQLCCCCSSCCHTRCCCCCCCRPYHLSSSAEKREHFCHVKLSDCAFSHYLRFASSAVTTPFSCFSSCLSLGLSYTCSWHTHTHI